MIPAREKILAALKYRIPDAAWPSRKIVFLFLGEVLGFNGSELQWCTFPIRASTAALCISARWMRSRT